MARIMDQLLGHGEIISRLARRAQTQSLPHAMIFCGPEGIGKFLAAKCLAQSLLCERGGAVGPCGECGPCKRILSEQSEAMLVFRGDLVPLKIENSRTILDFLSLQIPGRGRVIIIDEAQAMTAQAANALLKSIEEPPPNTFWIFITTSPGAMLPTIRSRAMTVRFDPLRDDELSRLIQAPDWVIRASAGRVSLAQRLSQPDLLSLRDQVFAPLQSLLNNSRAEALAQIEPLVKDRDSARQLVQWWREIVRDAWLPQDYSSLRIHQDRTEEIGRLSALGEADLEAWADGLAELDKDLLANVDRLLAFEVFCQRRQIERPR